MPPLILHPFGGAGSASELLDGSRAALAIQGRANAGPFKATDDESELDRRVVAGRYQEVRMLLFLGKDLWRWLRQCVDFIERSGDIDPRINEQSFAALLVESPPDPVRDKLEAWGVADRRAIFSRAIGVHSLFSEPPPPECLSHTMLRNYHRFADHAYICFQHLRPFYALDPSAYKFELYASEEYARLLSDQWEQDSAR
ncbi:MAG: hypothetical protein M3N54_09195 [Acidobacteriota bacterium]|nr:hypothetical protein [Acidobacteriota bacterium]